MGVLIFFAALIGVLLWIGSRYPGTGAEQLDWKPTRSYEEQARLEMEDIDQMLEAQNERRRRSGRPELTEDEVRADVAAASGRAGRAARRLRLAAPPSSAAWREC